MANFKACVRRPRSDGFWQVYIRVTHHRGLGYIKTDKMVTNNASLLFVGYNNNALFKPKIVSLTVKC